MDVAQVFTDVLSLLSTLGIDTYFVSAVGAIIVISVSAALLRFIR